ncbi:MAG: helix-turn-helix transcriptional regulator, partial [Proteobacteria bacterium]|nr:helix-turn-helix transcriptional regulator [Pseudomonadota bacterium]
TLLIMRDILDGARRFNEIRKGVPRMSPTLLSKRLKNLEACELIVRRSESETGTIEYLPTPAGQEVRAIVELYGIWGQRWVRGVLPARHTGGRRPRILRVGIRDAGDGGVSSERRAPDDADDRLPRGVHDNSAACCAVLRTSAGRHYRGKCFSRQRVSGRYHR